MDSDNPSDTTHFNVPTELWVRHREAVERYKAASGDYTTALQELHLSIECGIESLNDISDAMELAQTLKERRKTEST